MLVALTTGQKLALGGMALVFVAFALVSAFLLPRRNPDFPGPRGVRLFVAAAAVMFLAMLLTVILVKEEEAEGGHGAEAAAVEDVTETGETETGDTGVGETGTASTETDADEGGGGGATGNPEAGSDVYASAGCGGCHTFAAAESQGTIGPDLDQSSIDLAGAVQQIRNGGGGMPPFGQELSDEEIANVAAFVVERRGG